MAKQSITAPSFAVNNIQLLPDIYEGDPSVSKQAFDKASADIKAYITNTLLVEFANSLGANRVGFSNPNFSSDNVGDSLVELFDTIGDIVLDQIPDGTVTDVKLSNVPGQIKDRVTIIETAIANDYKIGTANIPTTGWVANTGDNPFKYDLAIVGVTTDSWVDLSIDVNSQDVALDAGINPTVTEYNGGVTLYANSVPLSAIPVRYAISKALPSA